MCAILSPVSGASCSSVAHIPHLHVQGPIPEAVFRNRRAEASSYWTRIGARRESVVTATLAPVGAEASTTFGSS